MWKLARWVAWGTGCLLAVAPVLAEETKLDSFKQVQALVQQALESEAGGDLSQRGELLARAAQIAPSDSAVRWQQGFVRQGKDWVSYENLTNNVKNAKLLEQYRELRSTSQPTLESQLKLADFCRRHNLKDQERVHLTAVIELDPDHADSRKRLGNQFLSGSWQKPEEVAAARKQAALVAATLRRLTPELKALHEDLTRGKLTVDEVAAQLSSKPDPTAIPAWELHLATPSAAGAAAVVKALSDMTAPEASQSLARQALYSPWPAREAATEALKSRDQQSVVPFLLSELHGAWLSTGEWARGSQGQLFCRFTLFADGQDKQELRVLDQVYYLQGVQATAMMRASAASTGSAIMLEARRAAENRAIQAHNEQVMGLLARLTGEQSAKSPQAWWQWWSEHNEVYTMGDKPIEASYAVRTAVVIGEQLPATSSGSSNKRDEKTRVKQDCLAGGTPILTSQGPVAVDRVRLGDMVVAKHAVTGEVSLKPVLRTTNREPERLIRIQLPESTIRASGGHPFWVSGKGWVRARELKAGMVLHGLRNAAEVREVVEEEKPARSFNLIVEDFHSYFVAQDAILSHDNTVAQPVRATVPGLVR